MKRVCNASLGFKATPFYGAHLYQHKLTRDRSFTVILTHTRPRTSERTYRCRADAASISRLKWHLNTLSFYVCIATTHHSIPSKKALPAFVVVIVIARGSPKQKRA